jgi:hypothetical protein
VLQALSWLAAERLQLGSLVSGETGAALSPAYFLNVLLEECITRCDWAAAGRCADQLGDSGMDDLTYRLLLQVSREAQHAEGGAWGRGARGQAHIAANPSHGMVALG